MDLLDLLLWLIKTTDWLALIGAGCPRSLFRDLGKHNLHQTGSAQTGPRVWGVNRRQPPVSPPSFTTPPWICET